MSWDIFQQLLHAWALLVPKLLQGDDVGSPKRFVLGGGELSCRLREESSFNPWGFHGM